VPRRIEAQPGQVGPGTVGAAYELDQDGGQLPDFGALQGQILELEAAAQFLRRRRALRLAAGQCVQRGLRQFRREMPEHQFANFGEQHRHHQFVRRDIGPRRGPGRRQPARDHGARLAGSQTPVGFVGFGTGEEQFPEGRFAQLQHRSQRRGGLVPEPAAAPIFRLAEQAQAEKGVIIGKPGEILARHLPLRLQRNQRDLRPGHHRQLLRRQIGRPLLHPPMLPVHRGDPRIDDLVGVGRQGGCELALLLRRDLLKAQGDQPGVADPASSGQAGLQLHYGRFRRRRQSQHHGSIFRRGTINDQRAATLGKVGNHGAVLENLGALLPEYLRLEFRDGLIARVLATFGGHGVANRKRLCSMPPAIALFNA